jgi:hypothetical protein
VIAGSAASNIGRRFSVDERRARLVERHRLSPISRTDDVSAIVDSLTCLHSSDPATVYLSAMVRMEHPSVDAVDSALYEERTLVRHHAMRRTIWVFTASTVAEAHWSSTVAVAENQEKVLAQFLEADGITSDGMAWIAKARPLFLDEIARRGITTTRELGAALPGISLPLRIEGGQLSTHSRTLLLMGFEGSIVRTRPIGTWISSQYRWSLMQSWYPDALAPMDRDAAEEGLVRRYLISYGPVTTTDVAWWTGWPKATVRSTLDRIGAVRVEVDDGEAWLDPDDEDAGQTPIDEPVVSLLPGLDSTVMGWRERDWYLDPAMAGRLFDRNGNAGPTIWIDGRVVGGWVQRASGEIATEILDPAVEHLRPEIAAEAARVRAMYGETRHKVRFPAPLQADRYG